jgi:hypothetical protein
MPQEVIFGGMRNGSPERTSRSKSSFHLAPLGLTCLVLCALASCKSTESGDKPIKVPVSSGPFEATVTVTGELKARNSLDIQGPTGLRAAGLWQVQITDLIDEGTRVKEGDYVATLDRTEASSKLKNLQGELDKTITQRTQAVLDSTLTLRETREALVNLNYALEEAKITLEQSIYEPPAIIRQAEINAEKAQRAYDQAVENYQIRRNKERARLQEIEGTMGLQRGEIADLANLLDQFEVRAPADGMVIYDRNWDGTRRAVGATISPWQSTVATLPDLSEMVSLTYINEVDISRIREGQEVILGVDAFPDRKYSGKVIEVANIGEQRPNSDAKVFEVKVVLLESDTTLRPAMTTANSIITAQTDTSLFAPSECFFKNDSISYVYVEKGASIVRREVITGLFNENQTVILAGIQTGEELYLSAPEKADELDWELLDPAVKEKALVVREKQTKPKEEPKPETPEGMPPGEFTMKPGAKAPSGRSGKGGGRSGGARP